MQRFLFYDKNDFFFSRRNLQNYHLHALIFFCELCEEKVIDKHCFLSSSKLFKSVMLWFRRKCDFCYNRVETIRYDNITTLNMKH